MSVLRRLVVLGVCGVALVVGLIVSSGGLPAAAVPATTEATSRGSAAPMQAPVFQTTPPTTAVATPTVAQPGEGGAVPDPDGGVDNAQQVRDENRRIWLVVAGLVAVAIALALVTIRYWRNTKPATVPTGKDRAKGDARVSAEDAASDRRAAPGRRTVPGRRSIPVADDEVAGRPRRPRSTPVVADPPVGRRSRRSVAGADHAGADDGWEPRGTGEHDRIEVSAAVERSRPSRNQRRSAYEAGRRR